MTIINQKSISGITSITTAAAGDNLLTFHTNDGTERFRIDNSGSTKITAGIVTTLTVTGNGTVGGTLGVTGNGTVGGTLGVTGETTFATHINLGDSDKAKFGAGSDLSIYHDGTDSYVDNSTGDLILRSTGDDVIIRATDDVIIQNGGSDNAIICNNDGNVELYFNTAKKLETKSDGVSVTGEIAATGAIDAEGRADIGSTSLNDYAVAGFTNSATYGGIYAQNNNANGHLFTGQENSNEVFKVFANGRINSGNAYTSGDGVNIFGGGSIYIRQDGATGGVLRIRNGSDYKIELKGNGNADFAGAVKIGGTAAANQIDEYEEGTFTPVLMGSTGNPTYTVTTQRSSYTKIGRLVNCNVDMSINIGGSGSGAVFVTLPFTCENNSTKAYTELVGARNNSWFSGANNTLVGFCVENTNQGYFRYQNGNSGSEAVTTWVTNTNTGDVRIAVQWIYYTD